VDARVTWEILIVAGVALLVATAQISGLDRRLWHWLANVTALERPLSITRFWVVDGDTIDDLDRNVRYRLANIDAPETGDSARCFREQERGEAAKWAAIRLLRDAKSVSVRRTWRWDRFGRRIAFIRADGQDLGAFLVRRGLARTWRGKREKWCGRHGGLAKIAATGGMPHDCATCRDWR
jgi:endonuclease YncB( thermonuclease family)